MEVWTKRAFYPHEIMLAPATTEIKDCYWTEGTAVMVNLPNNLKKYLGGKTLAFDGRMRHKFEEARPQNLGELAKEAMCGDLFFAIQRTADQASVEPFSRRSQRRASPPRTEADDGRGPRKHHGSGPTKWGLIICGWSRE